MAIRPIATPLAGERVLALSPENATDASTFWQRRLNLFAGRALSASALAQRQAWQAGHVAQRGQDWVPGTVDGFEAVVRGAAGGTRFADVEVHIATGRGLAVTGEDAVLRQPLSTTLADVSVIAPPGFFVDGSGVGAPTSDGSLNPREIGAALGALPAASRATLPGTGILLLQPALADTSEFDPQDPCDRSACDEGSTGDPSVFEDWRIGDAVRLLWYVWPSEWRALPAPGPGARNALAWTIFQAEAELPAASAMPWEGWGVPIALVQLDLATEQPMWADRASVVRRGGLARNARLQLATGTAGAPLLVSSSRLPSLQQARIEQFAEEVAALSAEAALTPEQLALSFPNFLPPMGLLPRDCYEPATRRSGFFPAGFDIDAVPVPVEQLDIAVRANAALAPLDMRGAESVRLLVPVPLASWEPRLLITNETPDAEFQRTLDRFLLVRSRTLGLRQGLRVRQSVQKHGLDGQAPQLVAWNDDDDAVETETLSPWGPAPTGGGHRSRLVAGLHQHYFERATQTLAPGADSLYCWVNLDPDHPPRTLMLQWHVAGADWEHRAYWGENLIAFGTDGTPSRQRIGELPVLGGWVRLEVPAASVGVANATLDGMAFTLFDGRAAYGMTGSGSGATGRKWFCNVLPDGAQLFGDDGWEMLTANDLWTPFEPTLGVLPAIPTVPAFASGGHADAPAKGLHFHSYDIALAPTPRPPAFAVQPTESLYAWVYLDPNDPPREIQLQWRVRDGNIARRVYWGWNQIQSNVADTHAGVYAGPLPQPGRWARLSVALSVLDLPNGASFTALDFMQFDGFAVFGPAGALSTAATGAPVTERPWIAITDAAGGGPTTNPGWNLLTAAQLRAPSTASINGRVAALDDLYVHPALQVLSAHERMQVYLLGVDGFSAYLKSRTDRADDLVDYGFVKVQTDVYRVRQLMLGTTAATRLAVSPVLATIAQAETATASQEQISSFIADLKKKVVATPPPPAPAAPVRAVARAAAAATTVGARAGVNLRLTPLATRVDTGVISVGGSVGTRIGSGVLGTTLGDSASVKVPISTGLAGSIGSVGSVAGVGSKAGLLDKRVLGDIQVIGVGGGRITPPAPPSPTDVANADPLTGSTFIRTTTIAKRLEDPKSKEARDYATSSRYEAVLSLVRLADTLTAEDGGVTPGLFEDVSMRGLDGDTFLDDLKPPEGGPPPLERPFTDFLVKRPLLGALLKVPTRLPAGQTTGDPDEGAMFSDSTDLSDHVVALMRKMEGRIKLYRDAIAVCNAVASDVRTALSTINARLVAVADELAEARHDVSVARSLLAEETERLDAVNANRIRVLADEVKFLAFVRPREVENLLATPTHSVDPGLLEAPVPACLRSHPDVPDEIADMMRVVREAPANWFVAAPPILQRLDRSEPLLRMVQVAKTRALSGLATPIVAATAGVTKISQAIASVATRQVQALAPRITAMQTLDLAALSGLTWQGQRVQAEQVVSFADLADGGHGRADVARSAAAELENIRSIAVCLHAEFSAVLPALRLQWAETLSEFDAAPNLRNLASLPRWSEIAFEDRKQMQGYVDWLFGQIEPNKPDAVALLNDVVRMCLLLASHAPVDRIITGRLARPMPAVVVGTRIPLLAIDASKLRVGMQAVAYRGEQVVARALVEDIGNAEISARVVQTMAMQVELGTDVRIHFDDGAMLSMKAASARRTLFGR